MPQPVKLSDALIHDARNAAVDADRSMAGQIEHWAKIGRSVEALLAPRELTAVKRGEDGLVAELPRLPERGMLLHALRLALNGAGHARLGMALRASGVTHYGTDAAFPGCLIRVSPDGARTPGHLVGRSFVPLGEAAIKRE